MKARTSVRLFIAGFVTAASHAAAAQTAKGVPEAVGQIKQINENVKTLFEKGSELSQSKGIDLGLKDIAVSGGKRVERAYDLMKTTLENRPQASSSGSTVDAAIYDNYAEQVINANLANYGDGGVNDALSRAADHAQAMSCKFYPDGPTCKQQPAPSPQVPAINLTGGKFTCNPVGLTADYVAEHKHAVFRVECSVSGLPARPGVNWSRGFFQADCKGWDSHTIVMFSPEIPDTGTIFPVQRTQTGPGQYEVLYSGSHFVTPCKPAWAGQRPDIDLGKAISCVFNPNAKGCKR